MPWSPTPLLFHTICKSLDSPAALTRAHHFQGLPPQAQSLCPQQDGLTAKAAPEGVSPPGLDAVPRVVEGVAHHICVGAVQLPEHLKPKPTVFGIHPHVQLLPGIWLPGISEQSRTQTVPGNQQTHPHTANLIVTKRCVGRVHHHDKLHFGVSHIAVPAQRVREHASTAGPCDSTTPRATMRRVSRALSAPPQAPKLLWRN